jgi:hypothetical protein
MMPKANTSTAVSATTTLRPLVNACTVSGAAYKSEKLSPASLPARQLTRLETVLSA